MTKRRSEEGRRVDLRGWVEGQSEVPFFGSPRVSPLIFLSIEIGAFAALGTLRCWIVTSLFCLLFVHVAMVA